MNPKLQYRPERYRERLSEYAAYTIDVVTPVGTFRQKANKQEDVIVIDYGHGDFSIHMSYQQILHYPSRPFRNPDVSKDFSARVKIKEDVEIEIKRDMLEYYFPIGWYIFLGAVAVINFLNAQPWFILLLLPLLPIPHYIQKVRNHRFRTMVINFLNMIAEN